MNSPLKLSARLDKKIAELRTVLAQCHCFSASDQNLISRAINRGKMWHSHQYRDTGDLYFIHPVRVAIRCLSFANDAGLICAALLHDTLEDTKARYQDITDEFNEDIAKLVKALTKFKQEARAVTVERIFKLAKRI